MTPTFKFYSTFFSLLVLVVQWGLEFEIFAKWKKNQSGFYNRSRNLSFSTYRMPLIDGFKRSQYINEGFENFEPCKVFDALSLK